jgi:hypothetical protein
MKELEMDAIAMAPINTPDRKQWVFHGKVDGRMWRITINLGDQQFRLIDAETKNMPELPCA